MVNSGWRAWLLNQVFSYRTIQTDTRPIPDTIDEKAIGDEFYILELARRAVLSEVQVPLSTINIGIYSHRYLSQNSRL